MDTAIYQAQIAETQKLDQLVAKSRQVIFSIQSLFPFDLFPDRLEIDETKVTIIHKEFFIIKQIFPILLTNINAVTMSTNLLFATLKIEVTGYETNPEPIKFLTHKDATRARRIILGLVASVKEGVDITKIPPEELRFKAEEIGRAREHQRI